MGTYEPKQTDIDLDGIKEGRKIIQASGNIVRTPLIELCQGGMEMMLQESGLRLWLKMENLQTTGSFKIRGATLQFHEAAKHLRPGQGLICYSGGNYGKAFAYVAGKSKLPATVLMPNTVPPDRQAILESLGASVEIHPYNDIPGLIKERVAREGRQYLDPFDDINLVKGYGSVALEILEQLGGEKPDIVLIPCGGGGLLSGVAAALRLSGLSETRIYGVEPENANTMSRSYKEERVASLPTSRSIATGLVPIRSGDVSYPVSRRFVDDIIEVTDEEIVEATKKVLKTAIAHKEGFGKC